MTPPKGLSRRAAIFIGLILAVLASMTPVLRSYVSQQQELSRLRVDVASRQTRVDDLANQLDRWGDDAFVVAQARQRFTYVFPGEVGYIVKDDPKAIADERDPSGAAARRAAASHGPWFSTLWTSVTLAGGIGADASSTPGQPSSSPRPGSSASTTP